MAQVDLALHGALQPVGQQIKGAQPHLARLGHQFGGCRGGGRAQVGAKVGNGEIGLVPHPADQRHRALHNGARQLLVVEGPQVLHRPTTAHQQDHIHHRGCFAVCRGFAFGPCVHLPQCGHHGLGRCSALHLRRDEHHGDVRHAAPQGCHHIVQGGCAQRGDQTDAPWLHRQRAFAARVEQAFAFQLGFEAQELLEQSALPRALHAFNDELQIAPGLVHPQAPAHFHQLPIARRKVKQARRPAEHGTAQLAVGVLDRKVAMPAGCA